MQRGNNQVPEETIVGAGLSPFAAQMEGSTEMGRKSGVQRGILEMERTKAVYRGPRFTKSG